MTNTPLHILQVHGWWKVERPGGVITMMKTLITGLEAQGHQVTMLINDWEATSICQDDDDGRTFYKLRLPPPPRTMLNPKAWLSWLLSLRRAVASLKHFVNEHKIDVVHLHLPYAYQWVFRLLRDRGGPPYIVTLHGGDVAGFNDQPKWIQALMRSTITRADVRVAVSGWVAGEGKRIIFPDQSARTIYNGIDADDLVGIENTPIPASYAERMPERYFIILANLHPVKGQDTAIRGWADVVAKDPDLHLVLMGSGPLEDELRSLVHDLSLDDNVHFLGHVPRAVALPLGKKAIGLLAPSLREGFSYVLIEAGLLRIPSIVSATQPFTEYLTHGKTALLFRLKDPHALAENVLELAASPELQKTLADNLQHDVESQFLAPVMAGHYVDAYRDAIAAAS